MFRYSISGRWRQVFATLNRTSLLSFDIVSLSLSTRSTLGSKTLNCQICNIVHFHIVLLNIKHAGVLEFTHSKCVMFVLCRKQSVRLQRDAKIRPNAQRNILRHSLLREKTETDQHALVAALVETERPDVSLHFVRNMCSRRKAGTM